MLNNSETYAHLKLLGYSDEQIVRAAARKLAREAAKYDPFVPLPHQVPPPGDWMIWLLLGGRGAGKTRTGAAFVIDKLRRFGDIRIHAGAPTVADARDVCAEGESGLITKYRAEFPVWNRSLLEATHIRGGKVKFFGSEKPARWNGPQCHYLWADELALWVRESWDMALMGLRLGNDPRAIATTTPKNKKWVKELADEEMSRLTKATTHDNPNLAKRFLEYIEKRYGGTRLGRQEILAEFITDIEGALVRLDWIEDSRRHTAPELSRVVVAVDPAVTATDTSDETGIVAAGLGTADQEPYILHAKGYRLTPAAWGQRVIDIYDKFGADLVIGEVNNGGDLVEQNLRQFSRNLPFKAIHASRGKIVRAEPVATMYEQGRIHHVGPLPQLEEQLTTFPVEGEYEHDDVLDADVYAVTELCELDFTTDFQRLVTL